MKNYVALGDLVLDVYHNSITNDCGYFVGGSPWNDLMNIASLDLSAHCYCIATCGNDWAGDYLLDELRNNRIDTTNITRRSKQTNRINILIEQNHSKSQLQCPICKQTIWHSNAVLPRKIPEQFITMPHGIVIVNSLNKHVMDLACSFSENGWFLAADIGYIGQLRYINSENLLLLFCNKFGIIQFPNKVYKFLLKKLSCNSAEELYVLLSCKYLSITDGGNGSIFVSRNQQGDVEVLRKSAITTRVVDTTGAGDAYFSMILNQLNNDGTFPMGIERAIENARLYAADRVLVVGAHGKYKHIEHKGEDCERCGSVKKQNKPPQKTTQRIETNTNKLLSRILCALDSEAPPKIRKALSTCNGNILLVGSGGSYVAAAFAANCISQHHHCAIAKACYPRDIIIQGINKTELVFLFSYSGKTKDIQNVYNYCHKRGIKTYIITQNRSLIGNGLYDDEAVISYGSEGKGTREQGFISMAGTLIPMCLFGNEFFHNSNMSFKEFLIDCFERRMLEYASDRNDFCLSSEKLIIDIFSGVDTCCAALDLESKFIESGLARVTIHEKKDFSHGRFNIVRKNPPCLFIFLDNACGAYSTKLRRYIENKGNALVLHMATSRGGIWGDLDLVIAAEFFAKYISRILNYDMARPDYSSDAMSLYKYAHDDLL